MPAQLTDLISVDRSSPVAAAEQIHSGIAAAIRSGDLSPGQRLPAVRALASDLGVAANTAAKAVRSLQEAGLVTTHGRGGTRVAAPDSVESQIAAAAREYAETARRSGLSRDDAIAHVRRALSELE